MAKNPEEGFATKAIHAGQDPSQWTHRSVVPPLIMSTTFQQEAPGIFKDFDYGRSGNPSRSVLERCLAELENAKHGFAFSSGLGACTAVTYLLRSGDHIISGNDIYGGTKTFFQKCATNFGLEVTFVTAENTKEVVEAVKHNTKMIWIECPTNPTLRVPDIKAISQKVKEKRPDIFIAIDNTFATCYFQKPLDLGADISVCSLTKYMSGHSDVIMGAAVTRRDDIAEKLRFIQETTGIVPSPFDCSLVTRSLKTLELRMQKHMENGLAVAKFLESHPAVEKVIHPLLASHPQHEVALKQMTGHSGMVSFYVKGDARKFLKSLKMILLAASLGGVESTIVLAIVMIAFPAMTQEELAKLGINDKLIRLSVGVETTSNIIADLDQALNISMK